jgi:hypothetical protein
MVIFICPQPGDFLQLKEGHCCLTIFFLTNGAKIISLISNLGVIHPFVEE